MDPVLLLFVKKPDECLAVAAARIVCKEVPAEAESHYLDYLKSPLRALFYLTVAFFKRSKCTTFFDF